MIYLIFSNKNQYNFLLNSNNESPITSLGESLISSDEKTVFSSNFIIKTFQLKVIGAQGLRLLPNVDLLNPGYLNLIIKPNNKVFNTLTNEFEVPDINIKKTTILKIADYDFIHQWNKFYDSKYLWNGTTYIAENHTINMNYIVASQGTPTISYDSLGINQIFLNRQCNLRLILEVDN